jgi:DNA-binding transcriptional ArsR family regulator/DNA-directed RNA polymerase specialized sigma24 family protein
MGGPFLSRFTPSIMAPETLEAIFVQREELADRLIGFIEHSAQTDSKQHNLLVGPRGIGKTHLVSIVYHRVRQLDCCKNNQLIIAWLREEEWGVMSFLDLLLRILRALIAEYKDSALEGRVETLYQHEPGAAERLAATLLREFLADRTLLVIVENLDDLFLGLEDEGQKRLRSYIQENPFLTILATSQSLFGGVSLQTSPFYGFFRISHLEELSLDEATLLLGKIAELEGDSDLASLIGTSLGRVRIRALQRLAGGNHRVYIIFSQFLTRESLTELIEAMMRTLDELTPYYHERIRWLSPQQRKIVELLSDRGNALSVKEIAARCFMSQQTASAQLKLLREWGYVRTNPVGRQSYYELREPLMRLCIEVKKHRDEPIRLVVELLRSWYTSDELRKRLDTIPLESVGGPRLEREHIAAALNLYQMAEVLVSLSQPNRIDQAMLRLMNGDDSERDQDIEIISAALKRMGFLTLRRKPLGDDSALSPEDVAQSSWLKLLGALEENEFTEKQRSNPSSYLYHVVRETVKDYRPPMRRIQFVDIDSEFDEEQERDLPEYLVASHTPSPDETLELRLHLLQYIQTYLFEAAGNQRKLRRRLEDLMGAVVGSGAEDVLSEALIKYFVRLAISEGSEAAAPQLKKWNALAIDVLGSSPEFELPLRLLGMIIRYLNTNDKRVFLELRLEERAFVDPLFDKPEV